MRRAVCSSISRSVLKIPVAICLPAGAAGLGAALLIRECATLAATAELGEAIKRERKALTTVIKVLLTPDRLRAARHIFPSSPPHPDMPHSVSQSGIRTY